MELRYIKSEFHNLHKLKVTVMYSINFFKANPKTDLPYFRYYKTVLYLFLRLFGHSSRPRTLFFLVSLELLVRLLFKGVLYSRASYNSGNTVIQTQIQDSNVFLLEAINPKVTDLNTPITKTDIL